MELLILLELQQHLAYQFKEIPMPGKKEYQIIACGSYSAAIPPVLTGQGVTAVRNGAGDVTLTYDGGEASDATETCVQATARAAVGFSASVSALTDTTVQILAANAAGAAADSAVDFVIYKFAP
jgi:hypothetical protein